MKKECLEWALIDETGPKASPLTCVQSNNNSQRTKEEAKWTGVEQL